MRLVSYNLESSGYRVLTATSGEEALHIIARESLDLVILDVRMPGMDGFEVCERIREFSMMPIVMLTAKSESADKVKGLHLGADDYITKPFAAEELLARVEAVLRRSRFSDRIGPNPTLSWGELYIDFAQRRVTMRGKEVRLTPTEYRLLHCLAAYAGRVVPQEEIQEKVWGPEYREQFEGVRVYIRRLRQKIEEQPEAPMYIITHAGVGYSLSRP